MSILASAGFSPTDASLVFAALFTFMIGQLDVDVDVAEAGGPAAAAVQSAATATDMTPDEIFEFGFDAVIEGLKLKLRRALDAARISIGCTRIRLGGGSVWRDVVIDPLFDAAVVEDPHEYYARLREADPCTRSPARRRSW